MDPELVKKGRHEELEYFHKYGVYNVVPRSKCYEETGKTPVTTRWVDTNKGDDVSPDVRCRLVARQVKTHADHTTFASTPPLENLKYFLAAMVESEREACWNLQIWQPERLLGVKTLQFDELMKFTYVLHQSIA